MRHGLATAAGFLAAVLLVSAPHPDPLPRGERGGKPPRGAAVAQEADCPVAIGIPRPAACQETVLVFVTQGAFQGNFGGLAGADARCQAAARQAGLPGVFRAWLSTAAEPAGARIAHRNVPYVMPGGIRVADNYDDLTDGDLAHPIDRTEYGAAVASPFLARTATTAAGRALSPTCADWTSRRRYDGGWWGAVDMATPAWSRTGVFPGRCDYLAHLYCLEQ